jgi:PGF-CTERM protein
MAGILQEIADEYGWNTYKDFFHLFQSNKVQKYPSPSTTEDQCNLFVACLNIVTDDNLTTRFANYGLPLNAKDVNEWEIKIMKEEIPTPTPKEGVPGFEAAIAIAGLLAVAYLLRKKG